MAASEIPETGLSRSYRNRLGLTAYAGSWATDAGWSAQRPGLDGRGQDDRLAQAEAGQAVADGVEVTDDERRETLGV